MRRSARAGGLANPARRILALAPGLLLLSVTAAEAQFSAIQFSYSNPGARSLALAGAFVALADDATAVYANPAGLVRLKKMEISLEMRYWDYTTPFTEGGRVSGTPTGILLDTTPGLRTGEDLESTLGVSFFSFVYPSKRCSFAVYRHLTVDFEKSTATQGLFSAVPPGGPIFGQERWEDASTTSDLEIVNYGVSGAFKISDRLSVGAGVSLYSGDLADHAALFGPLPATLPQGPYGPNLYLPEAIAVERDRTIEDTAWAFNAGLLWQFSEQWSVGTVYRGAPTFHLNEELRSGPVYPGPAFVDENSVELEFPDVFGLAFGFQSSGGTTTLSIEWDRVRYSNFVKDPGIATTTTLEDGDEYRLGFEYVFVNNRPVVGLRAGVWRDPDHSFKLTSSDLARILFPPGEDEMHYAFGAGIAYETFQLDLGVDLSDLVDTASLSAIVRF